MRTNQSIYPTVSDYRQQARKRLPRFAFDYLDGGAEAESTQRANEQAFAQLSWLPRVLCDVSQVDTTVHVLGQRLAVPVVVGPTGLNGLYWPRAEEHLAAAAHAIGAPFALSTASTSLMEDVRAHSAGPIWLQLYVHQNRKVAEDLMHRARALGCTVLILTVDVPVNGHRDRDKRNGFQLPLKFTPNLIGDALRHPRWLLRMAPHGLPQLRNVALSQGVAADLEQQARDISRRPDQRLNWTDMDWIRRHWEGAIVIKGIQTVADAQLAVAHGADGLVVSNHGGRQLDGSPATLAMLPGIADAVGHRLDVLVDGGVRRGSDVAKALALGAKAVLLGRAPLYGLAAFGPSGARQVLQKLRSELETTLKLLGCTRAEALGPDYLNQTRPQVPARDDACGGLVQQAVVPPSTTMAEPVTKLASSEAR